MEKDEQDKIYVIPSDRLKQARLIANKYRKIDLAILIISSIITAILDIIIVVNVKGINSLIMIITITMIGSLAFILTTSWNVYHNMYIYLKAITYYLINEKNYVWGGKEYGFDKEIYEKQ